MQPTSANPIYDAILSEWHRLTLATCYEVVLPDSIEVVKQKLSGVEKNVGQTKDVRYRIQFTTRDEARSRFNIIQDSRSQQGIVLYQAYINGYLKISESLNETRIVFKAYPSRITLFAATAAFVAVSIGLLNEKAEGIVPLLFVFGVEFLWIYSLCKARDDLYHRVVELVTDPTVPSELMNTATTKLLRDIARGTLSQQQEAALNLGLLLERHHLPDPSQLQLIAAEYRRIQLNDEEVIKIVEGIQQVLLEQASPNSVLFWAIGKAKASLTANILFSLIDAIGERLDGAAAYQAIIALDNVLVMAEEKPNLDHIPALKRFLTRMSASTDNRSREHAQRILSHL
jgi:hypothetical protein